MHEPPPEALELLRSEIERNRGLATMRDAAITIGLVSSRDGLVDWWTLFVSPTDVWLVNAAAPIEYVHPLVTLHVDEVALATIARGGTAAEVDVHGDVEVLKAFAPCLRAGSDRVALRSGK